ncbi:tyrosine-type recombinase/integrase [Vibrio sp. SCSIO 43136]|uniref:tyrosine-type recombinase/integrase n=1 Tax=Vibrio sp. SCSIO 43136 TaxID=2819101 RepID=UPI002075CA8E|nr:tyrosine-type recombinase/integrase [Vibrio sp. SCSIO 43136]USD68226.1 tyrosine-type recombinase/integrase [Vibrio sp. SCSIO 43136]
MSSYSALDMKKICTPISEPSLRKKSVAKFSYPIDVADMAELTSHNYSINSLKSMTNDWNRFVEFVSQTNQATLPASVNTLLLFLESQCRTRKLASIKRSLISLATVHRLHGYAEPTNHRQVKLFMSNVRVIKKDDARHSNAFTNKHYLALNELFSNGYESKDARDMALYGIALECALKRNEIRSLNYDDLTINDSVIAIQLNSECYNLSDLSIEWLNRWLSERTHVEGPLFCRVDRHQNILLAPLNDSSIYRIFRNASDLLNLGYNMRFGGQSSRAGAAMELAKQGLKLKEIQEFGRWNSPVMPAQYLKRAGIAEAEQLKFIKIRPWD